MLQWNLEDKDKIVSALLVNLKPSAFEGQIPCLPAHLLFMCLRYGDHIKNEHQVTVLLEGIIKGIQQVSLLISFSMDVDVMATYYTGGTKEC